MKFAIHTQTLENYGAHSEDGKFSSGNHYWKFKPGTTYIVSDVDRIQDAAAFVMAAFSENGLGWKEFPCTTRLRRSGWLRWHQTMLTTSSSRRRLLVGCLH